MKRHEPQPNVPYTVLRLYFEHGAPVAGRQGWRKLLGQPLAHELLKAAKALGIEQAIAFNVTAGYLRGDALHHGHHEHPPVQHPQCVELIDSADQIARFLEQNEPLLAQVRVLLRESGNVER
jgi:PII-like signaling protein